MFHIWTCKLSHLETVVAEACAGSPPPPPSSSAEFLFWKIVSIHMYLLFVHWQEIATVFPMANLLI